MKKIISIKLKDACWWGEYPSNWSQLIEQESRNSNLQSSWTIFFEEFFLNSNTLKWLYKSQMMLGWWFLAIKLCKIDVLWSVCVCETRCVKKKKKKKKKKCGYVFCFNKLWSKTQVWKCGVGHIFMGGFSLLVVLV